MLMNPNVGMLGKALDPDAEEENKLLSALTEMNQNNQDPAYYGRTTGPGTVTPPVTEDNQFTDSDIKPVDDSALDHYMELLGNKPEYTNPSTGRKIAGSLLAALGAFGGEDLNSAVNLGKSVTEGPYKRAMSSWESELEKTKPILNTSVGLGRVDVAKDRVRQRLQQNLDTAEQKARELDAKIEIESRKANNSEAVTELKRQKLIQDNAVAVARTRIQQQNANTNTRNATTREGQLERANKQTGAYVQSVELMGDRFDRTVEKEESEKKDKQAKAKAKDYLTTTRPDLFEPDGAIIGLDSDGNLLPDADIEKVREAKRLAAGQLRRERALLGLE